MGCAEARNASDSTVYGTVASNKRANELQFNQLVLDGVRDVDAKGGTWDSGGPFPYPPNRPWREPSDAFD